MTIIDHDFLLSLCLNYHTEAIAQHTTMAAQKTVYQLFWKVNKQCSADKGLRSDVFKQSLRGVMRPHPESISCLSPSPFPVQLFPCFLPSLYFFSSPKTLPFMFPCLHLLSHVLFPLLPHPCPSTFLSPRLLS